ncbi:MAG: hypothetical protein NTX25_05450 [Proteobacteria bacterium]|nr:hypothetical protein [Pseudomonadota bacterium]
MFDKKINGQNTEGSQKGSSKPVEKLSQLFRSGQGRIFPVLAVLFGMLIGMGTANLIVRAFAGANKTANGNSNSIDASTRDSALFRMKLQAKRRPPDSVEGLSAPSVRQLKNSDSYRVTEVHGDHGSDRMEPSVQPSPAVLPKAVYLSGNRSAGNTSITSSAAKQVNSKSTRNRLAMIEDPLADPARKARGNLSRTTSQPLITLRNLSYSRRSFNQCSEDCRLIFRSAEGEFVKTRLKKSAFQRVLQSKLAYADIDGYERIIQGQRMLVIKSIRGVPVGQSLGQSPVSMGHGSNNQVQGEKQSEPVKAESARRESLSEGKDKDRVVEDKASKDTIEIVSVHNQAEAINRDKKKEDLPEAPLFDLQNEHDESRDAGRARKFLE